MTKLSQRDPRWASLRLGASKLTIGRWGCTTTCIAMIDGTTPDLLAHNAANYTKDGLVLWQAISRQLKNSVFEVRDVGYNEAKINEFLKAGTHHVLFEVNDGAHWVVAKSRTLTGNDYLVIDPWDGKECKVKARYKNITKAVYFRKLAETPVVIPEDLERFIGRFLIATEQHGRLFYVTPEGKRIDLGEDPVKTIAKLAHGIRDVDLYRIPE